MVALNGAKIAGGGQGIVARGVAVVAVVVVVVVVAVATAVACS